MSQSANTIERDFSHHTRVRYTNRLGAEYLKKPGRKKLLSADQAALVFEPQVQIKAANRLIDRVLDSARVYPKKNARARILKHNWEDRGRIDVLRAAAPKRARA